MYVVLEIKTKEGRFLTQLWNQEEDGASESELAVAKIVTDAIVEKLNWIHDGAEALEKVNLEIIK